MRGVAKLEFALMVAVIGVIGMLALSALADLQVLGRDAQRQTAAAQQRAISALNQARCPAHTASNATTLIACP